MEFKPLVNTCCSKRHPTMLQHDLVFVDKLEAFSNRLHDDLETRARAMKNWKKLRILIVLFKICGNKTMTSNKSAYEKDEKVKLSCKERIAPFIINP